MQIMQAVDAAEIAANTVILNLDLGKVTNRRIVSSDTENIETEIDRKMLHVGIDLFDAKELRDCVNFQQSVKHSIKKFTVPSFLRGGMYMVKLEAIQQVEDILLQAQEPFALIVESFASVVDQRRDDAKDRLKGEFDAKLYPDHDEVVEKFRIEWSWLSVGTPDTLKKIDTKIWERETAKAEKTLKSVTDGITTMLAVEAKELGDHLLNRLQPDADGRPKQIRKSAVDNVKEFLKTFNLRAIGTSAELNAQVERIEKLVEGVSASDLKVSEHLRKTVSEGFKEVAAKLDEMIVSKPKRYMGKGE